MANPYAVEWADPTRRYVRLGGSLTFTDPANQPGGGSASVPVADDASAVVDTTTYDNTVTGSGKLTTIVFPQDTVAFAIALAGDSFPRWLFLSDSTDGLYFGDGTVDAYASGAFLSATSGNDLAIGGGGINLAVRLAAKKLTVPQIPTADPHVAGQVWSNSGVLTVSAG
jgi:hypothetical protein